MQTDSESLTNKTTSEVPILVIRLRRDGQHDLFFSQKSPVLLVDSKTDADCLTDSEACLKLAALLSTDYRRFRLAKIVHYDLADKPEPVTIKFHVHGGRGASFEKAKKLHTNIRLRVQERYPDAHIASHFYGACLSDYCFVSNAGSDAVWIETEVRAIMNEEYQKIEESAIQYA